MRSAARQAAGAREHHAGDAAQCRRARVDADRRQGRDRHVHCHLLAPLRARRNHLPPHCQHQGR
eukprot:1530482-Rhodomonas_salina.4